VRERERGEVEFCGDIEYAVTLCAPVGTTFCRFRGAGPSSAELLKHFISLNMDEKGPRGMMTIKKFKSTQAQRKHAYTLDYNISL